MSTGGDERAHDYVDGRMTPDERAAFERRLAADPRLAREVRALREIGAALRGGEVPALSPGFHARARERFEAAGRGGPRGIRLLSWESAGLALAAVLATTLFLPHVVRRAEVPGEEIPVPAEARPAAAERASEPAAPAEPSVAQRPAGERPPPRAPAAADGRTGKPTAPQTQSDLDDDRSGPGSRRKRPAGEPAPPRPAAPAVERAESASPAAEPPSFARDRGGEPGVAAGKAEASEVAPERTAARSAAGRAAAIASDAEAEPRLEAGASIESPRAARAQAPEPAPGRTAKRLATGPAAVSPVAAVPIGAAALGGRRLRVVEREAEWRDLLGGPAGPALGRLGPPDPGLRLVLVGAPGASVDCSGLRWSGSADAVEVLPAAAAPGKGSEACAFTVPRDGREIRLASFPGDAAP